MLKITNLPNLAKTFQQAKIIMDVDMAISQFEHKSLIAASVGDAIRSKQAPDLIIQTLREMIQDNREAMEDILGVELCQRIHPVAAKLPEFSNVTALNKLMSEHFGI